MSVEARFSGAAVSDGAIGDDESNHVPDLIVPTGGVEIAWVTSAGE